MQNEKLQEWVTKAFQTHNADFGEVVLIHTLPDASPVFAETIDIAQLEKNRYVKPRAINFDTMNDEFDTESFVMVAKSGSGLTNLYRSIPLPDGSIHNMNDQAAAKELRSYMINQMLRRMFEDNESDIRHGCFAWEDQQMQRHLVCMSPHDGNDRMHYQWIKTNHENKVIWTKQEINNESICNEFNLRPSDRNGWGCFSEVVEEATDLMDTDPKSDQFNNILRHLHFLGKVSYDHEN